MKRKKYTGKNSDTTITQFFLTQFLTQIGTQLQNRKILLCILTVKSPVQRFSWLRDIMIHAKERK